MISVIIPVYNVEDYLHVCINSVLKQTYQDFEIICIDDASTDSSLNILEYFSSKDSRIKILKNEKHAGENFCKKKGLEIAHGNYIYFLESRGWLDSNAFEAIIPILKKFNLDILLFKNKLFDDKSKEFIKDSYFDVKFMQKFNLEVFNYDNFDNVMKLFIQDLPLNKIYLKKFFDENNIFVNHDQSYDVFAYAQKISFLDEYLFNYRDDNSESPILDLSRIFNNLISKLTSFLSNLNNDFTLIQFEFSLIFNMMNAIESVLIKKNLFDYFNIHHYNRFSS